MSIQAEDLIERRSMRRKLTFWRAATFVLAALTIAGLSWLFTRSDDGRAAPHIAKVRVEGTITENEDLLERLDQIRQSEGARGVLLVVDSPGGTTVGGEATYEAVRRLAESKPVVAQVGTLAASAGYMIAMAADHIVARQSSIIGSIGVLVQFPNFSGLMEKLGVTLEEVKSSPLKAEPSPFNPTTEPERAMIRSMIMDSYDWFVGLVDERRPLDRAQVLALADGSIFTGRQAQGRKLVDELGGEREAVAWLMGKGVAEGLPVIEWKPKDTSGWVGYVAGSRIAPLLGLGSPSGSILDELGLDRLFLDGLVSVWQPENSAARHK